MRPSTYHITNIGTATGTWHAPLKHTCLGKFLSFIQLLTPTKENMPGIIPPGMFIALTHTHTLRVATCHTHLAVVTGRQIMLWQIRDPTVPQRNNHTPNRHTRHRQATHVPAYAAAAVARRGAVPLLPLYTPLNTNCSRRLNK